MITQLNNLLEIDTRRELCEILKGAGIATTNSIEEFDCGKGWLYDLKHYQLHHEIIIEGPCAFYGGIYSPNPWSGPGGLCSMGAYSYSHSALPEGIRVGRYCSIAKGLRFLDFSHPVNWVSSSVAFFFPESVKKKTVLSGIIDKLIKQSGGSFSRKSFDPLYGKSYPTIEHDVWIGENVTLAMGITIGTGSIIASNSTVTKDVPPYSIVAGVPAEIKKYRFHPNIIDALMSLQWWQYNMLDFGDIDFTAPDQFVDELKYKVSTSSIQPWSGETVSLPHDITF